MTKSRHTTQGFTIVETLVAITILMVAIAGPLTIANQAMHAAYDARNQMIASNLAQETMENLKNLKDNGTFTNISSFATGQDYAIAADGNASAGYSSVASCSPALTCILFAGQYGYTYGSGNGGATPFSRYFYVSTTNSDGNALSTDEVLVTVVVSWMTGPISNQVQIQELLTSASR